MTGLEFKDYVLRIFKRTDKDTEVYEATTDVIADIRIQLKAEEYKEEAYITGITTLGDYRIALPTDFGHLIGNITLVDDSSSHTRILNKISKQKYDEKYGERLLTSQDFSMPVDFCIYGKQIYLGCVPDSITYKYQMNYTTEPFTDVDASTDPVPFTDKYRSMLRAGVLAELYAGMELLDESAYWRSKQDDGIIKLKANDDDNISDEEGVAYHGF